MSAELDGLLRNEPNCCGAKSWVDQSDLKFEVTETRGLFLTARIFSRSPAPGFNPAQILRLRLLEQFPICR